MRDLKLVTKDEAATFLCISKHKLNRMISAREIPYYKLGESRTAPVKFDTQDLMKWMQKFRVERKEA